MSSALAWPRSTEKWSRRKNSSSGLFLIHLGQMLNLDPTVPVTDNRPLSIF